jgi:hypothetical protein
MGVGRGVTMLPCKKIVEKPPRNSAGFCGGGQALSWAMEPRKEKEKKNIDVFEDNVGADDNDKHRKGVI